MIYNKSQSVDFMVSKNDRWILTPSSGKVTCYHSSGGSYEVLNCFESSFEYQILTWIMHGGVKLSEVEANFKSVEHELNLFEVALNKLCEKKIIKVTRFLDFSVLTERDRNRYRWLLEHFGYLERDNISCIDMFLNLRKANVCVIGLGGLGSMMAQLFASVGILKFTLIDGDYIAEDNLPRQILYKDSDKGISKVAVMKRTLEEYEPLVEVSIINSHISSLDMAINSLSGFDLVVLCGDQPRLEVHAWIGEASLVKKFPYIAMGGNWVGPISVPYNSPCYICQAKFNRAHIPDYEGFVNASIGTATPPRAAFGPGPTLIGGLMSTVCIEFLAGVAPEKYKFERFKLGFWKENTIQKLVRYKDCRRCSQESM
ncbi:ThiF family adenylyltransferase [Pseudomonas syringae pv. theae]|uniref:ThiF family adenylyltransferase n=1 Tax=Pseudomonas syringae TaxID=317 RepID=UPI001F21F933|nr:ThiF family adenylyltransferase [Pseudomonas syringae]MBL3828458.1 ThiF family adenylyltransferase [Pseudomonas syringae pv. theae]MBL3833826.1 ThiF family adenylyltransferase [Pseudomonas syringae pv. theae]MBL3866229.1 ThiF family adenylyltransferase [Pseudomonas syringae pv. theae]GKQ47500.1 ThiF family adenylyltransferase [Pseudomonas syringae pv. theae]GKS05347.1 ThiF family adenylyltransferase [Pseudomonas syringae pv. theae]